MELIIVIGAFGSGKSEYAINLARMKHDAGQNVALVDMDIVNPYFRSRDVRDAFTAEGIEVVCPSGEYSFADVPALSPRIKGAINDPTKTVILDVGGDPSGCRVLSRFQDEIRQHAYDMRLVINTKRPFTSGLDEILAMQQMLERVSGLKVTHFVCNTNLMEFTTAEVVEEGIAIVQEAAKAANVAFDDYLVLNLYQQTVPDGLSGKKRFVMHYYLNKPWENGELTHPRLRTPH